MAKQLTNRISPVELTSFNAASLSGTYQAVNSSGLDIPCFILQFTNASTANITISFDGISDHLFMPGTADDISRNVMQINAPSPSSFQQIVFAKNSIIYVKGSAGVGTFYVSGFGQKEVNI
jgi:hypothetical protein